MLSFAFFPIVSLDPLSKLTATLQLQITSEAHPPGTVKATTTDYEPQLNIIRILFKVFLSHPFQLEVDLDMKASEVFLLVLFSDSNIIFFEPIF